MGRNIAGKMCNALTNLEHLALMERARARFSRKSRSFPNWHTDVSFLRRTGDVESRAKSSNSLPSALRTPLCRRKLSRGIRDTRHYYPPFYGGRSTRASAILRSNVTLQIERLGALYRARESPRDARIADPRSVIPLDGHLAFPAFYRVSHKTENDSGFFLSCSAPACDLRSLLSLSSSLDSPGRNIFHVVLASARAAKIFQRYPN